MPNPQCADQLEDSTQCGCVAVDNSAFCFSHDPNQQEKKLEACRKGGYLRGKSARVRKPLPHLPINKFGDISIALDEVMQLMKAREISPSEAREMMQNIRLQARLLGLDRF